MFSLKRFITYVGVMHMNTFASLVCRTCTNLIFRYLFKGLGDSSKYCSTTFLNVFLMFSALLYNTYTIYFTEWWNAKISCVHQLKVFFLSSHFPLRNIWIAEIWHQHQEENFVVEKFHYLASIRFWCTVISGRSDVQISYLFSTFLLRNLFLVL